MSRDIMQKPKPHSRARGSAYVAILGVSLLVAAIGFSAVIAARVQLRAAEQKGDVLAARAYARSALELGRAWMSADPNWRRNRPNGVWADRRAIDRGSFTLEVVDPNDGSLSNWPTDPVVMTATGFARRARQMQSITLVPDPRPLGCLELAVISDGTFAVNAGTVTSQRPIGTNLNFLLGGASLIDCGVEAGGWISGVEITGTRVSNAARRAMPDAAVIDMYVAGATPISYNSLGGGSIQDTLLSPQNNPYGATNPSGLYVIDCAGKTFILRNSRIVGTLILLNPKSDSRIEGAVHVAPAVANFPALLIRGPMNVLHGDAELAESSGRNFNPPGTPYEGVSNLTATDRYPSAIRGLVYVSGAATLNCRGTITGPLVAGGITATGTLTFGYDGSYLANPPPGFGDASRMVVVPGSARRVVR